jgi:hypothetical protein
MARGIGPPRVAVKALTSRGRTACRGPRLSWRRELLVRTSGLSWEAGTCSARRRLFVRGGDRLEEVPLVGNWSKMLPTGQEQDILPVIVLTGVLSPPHLESWPLRCQSWPSHCQWCQKTLSCGRLYRRQMGPLFGPSLVPYNQLLYRIRTL